MKPQRITITDVVKSFDVWRLLTGFDGPTVRRRLRSVVEDAARRHQASLPRSQIRLLNRR